MRAEFLYSLFILAAITLAACQPAPVVIPASNGMSPRFIGEVPISGTMRYETP